MVGVCSTADCTKAVKGGNASIAGEVAVTASADGDAVNLGHELFDEGEQIGRRRLGHWWSVDAAGDIDRCARDLWRERTDCRFDTCLLVGLLDADIDADKCFGGHHIVGSARAGDSRRHSRADLRAVERRDGDDLVFAWKPGLVGPTKRSRVNIGDVDTSVRKGIFMPSVTVNADDMDRHRSLIDLRMRYRTHDEVLQQKLNLDEASPNLVISGMQASYQWVLNQIKQGGSVLSEALEAKTVSV